MAGHSPPTRATATEPVSWTSMAVATFCSGFRSHSSSCSSTGSSTARTKPDGHPDAAEVPLPRRAGAAAAERMGDHVDVDVAGIADHPGADPAAEQSSPSRPASFLCREMPTTIWVALTLRAKSSSAAAGSSPVTMW